MPDKLLTIAIPTFNRREIICDHVNHILAHKKIASVDYIISDNCSEDGTYFNIKNLAKSRADIRILKSEKNYGFVGNFWKLINVSKSKYILITSDEDFIDFSKLEKYIKFIRENEVNLISPIFRIPKFLFLKKIYRGKIFKQYIDVNSIHSASFFTSGLTFKVNECKKYISKINDLINKKNSFALIYPQVLMSYFLTVKKNQGIFCPIEIVRKEREGASFIETFKTNEKYYSPASRKKQIDGHLSFLALLAKENKVESKKYLALINSIKVNLFYSVGYHLIMTNRNSINFTYLDYLKCLFKICKKHPFWLPNKVKHIILNF